MSQEIKIPDGWEDQPIQFIQRVKHFGNEMVREMVSFMETHLTFEQINSMAFSELGLLNNVDRIVNGAANEESAKLNRDAKMSCKAGVIEMFDPV